MHLVQILLPLTDNKGAPLGRSLFSSIKKELTEKFGGITAFSRSPAEGRWKSEEQVVKDEIIILEVMDEKLDRVWWTNYRLVLEKHFRQDEIIIRILPMNLI